MSECATIHEMGSGRDLSDKGYKFVGVTEGTKAIAFNYRSCVALIVGAKIPAYPDFYEFGVYIQPDHLENLTSKN